MSFSFELPFGRPIRDGNLALLNDCGIIKSWGVALISLGYISAQIMYDLY